MWCQVEIETDGGILGRISPFVAMSLVKQMTPYHSKENLLLEGVRYNARRISRRWAVLGRTAH